MKKFLLYILLLLLLSTVSYSQNCEEFPKLLDSAYRFSWDTTINNWLHTEIQKYTYNSNGKVTSFEIFDAQTKIHKTKKDYFYTNDNKILETYSYKYVNGNWVNVQNVVYVAVPAENARYETVYNWVNNNWFLQSRSINYYEDGKRIGYKSQLINKTTQDFYDYANFYINYNDRNEIDDWYGIKISDNSYIFNRLYFYDSDTLHRRLIYLPKLGQLFLSTQNLFHNDVYGLNNITINQRIDINDNWYDIEKYENFYKLYTSTNVYICQRRRTRCVPTKSVANLLKNGATLGKCPVVSNSVTLSQRKELEIRDEIVVYPNPARDYIKIKNISGFGETVYLYGTDGHLISVIDNSNHINIGNLLPGIYILKIGNDFIRFKKD